MAVFKLIHVSTLACVTHVMAKGINLSTMVGWTKTFKLLVDKVVNARFSKEFRAYKDKASSKNFQMHGQRTDAVAHPSKCMIPVSLYTH